MNQRHLGKSLAIALPLLLAVSLLKVSADGEELRGEFVDSPLRWQSRPLWFWNGKLDAEKTKGIVAACKTAGYYGMGILPSDGMGVDFMNPEFLKQYKVAVDEAGKLDMKMCLYDEYWFPSGSAGGLLASQHPEALSNCLDMLAAALPDNYKIIWDSPSQDSLDSMPLSGRLGAGANVWVQDGSVWLYLAHSGAFDEHGRLLKLGCIRITPVCFKLGESSFRQELDLSTGTITIRQGGFKAALWFAGETLVYQSESKSPAALEVAFGTWREKTKDGIRNDMMGAKTTFTGDQIKTSTSGFLWFHRNADYPQDLAGLAKSQGTSFEAMPDVTARRVSGAAVCVEGGMSQPVESHVRWQFWDGKAWIGIAPARTKQIITMRLEGAVDTDPQKWHSEAKAMLDQKRPRPMN
jgi:hypothetical protein